MSRWYRAYEGTASDPKLAEAAVIAGTSRSVVIATWHCLLEAAANAQDHGRHGITSRRVAATLGEPVSAVDAVLAAFDEIGLVHDGVITAWAKRQFESDSSTERSRKSRALSRNVAGTLQQQPATVEGRCATPPETETDTETEQKEISPPPPAPANENVPKPSAIRIDWSEFDAFWISYPRKVDKKAAKRVWEREVRRGVRPKLITKAARAYAELMRDSEPQFVKHPSTWLNATEFEDDRLWPHEPRAGPDLTKLTPSQLAVIEGVRLSLEPSNAHPPGHERVLPRR